MKRREFIAVLGSAAAWPLVARAQQLGVPVVGYLAVGAGGRESGILDAFRGGLSETGYVDGKDVLIEQRVGDGKTDQLPAFAADLVNHRVAAIAALGLAAAHAAKAATTDTPIIFLVGADPVKAGFVTSFNRPDANATGIMFFTSELEAKRLGLLHEIVPNAKKIAVLANPANPVFEQQLNEITWAARSLGLALIVQRVDSEHDLDLAFADFAQRGAEALLVAAAPFFFVRSAQVVARAAQYRLPAVYEWRDITESGGLMSYGTSLSDAARLVGMYVGRILKGEKPAELPIMQTTKFEFAINLRTANALGLTVPPALLARADKVIE